MRFFVGIFKGISKYSHGSLKIMSDKKLNREARKKRKETTLNLVSLALFAVRLLSLSINRSTLRWPCPAP
jgi:hypothetical protein